MKRLGTPYTRGKSDVIENFAPVNATAVAEGLAVTLTASGEIKAATSASDVIVGVAGMAEFKRQSVVRNGLEVYVKLATAAEPAIGKPVYVTAAGEFTEAAKTGEVDNVAVNATFRSAKIDCKNSKGETVVGAAIDFAGGL